MDVKVVNKGRKYFPFSELHVGDTFKLKSDPSLVYLRVPYHEKYDINAITLVGMDEETPNSNVWYFDVDTTVTIVESELTLFED